MYAGLKLLVGVPSVAPEPPQQRPWVHKDTALACVDCSAVYSADGLPCPACGSKHGWPLAKWLDRTATKQEEQS